MAEVSEIIIDVEVNAGESAQKLAEVKKNIADLKKEQKQLQDFIRAGADVTGELSARYAENAASLKQLTAEEKMYTAQLNIATQGERKYGDSLVEMSAQLAQLKQEYRGLSKEQREAAGGKELLNQIQEMDKALKEADASMGDHQRNVGNYASALLGLNGNVVKVASLFQGGFRNALAAAGKSLAAFTNTLLTTPWGWVVGAIGAIAGAFRGLGDAIKSSDELSTQMQQNMAGWEALKTRLKSGFTELATHVMNGLTFITDKIDELGNAIASLFRGKDYAEQQKQITETVKGYWQELIQAEDELQDKRREFAKEEAETEKEISRYRVIAADSERYSVEERKNAIDRIIRYEYANAYERKKIAEQNYKNLKLRAALEVNTTDEMKDRITAAYVEMIKTQTDYNNSIVRGTRQRSTFRKQEAAEEERRRRERQQAAQAARAKRIEGEHKELEELRKLEDMRLELIKNEDERQIAQVRLQYKRQIEDLQRRLKEEENLTTSAREHINAQIKLLVDKGNKEVEKLKKEHAERIKRQEQELAEWEESNFAQALAHVAELGKQMSEEAKAQYELSRSQYENSVQERLNAVYGSVTEAAQIELEQAEQFYKSLEDMDAVTRAAIFGEGKQAEEDYKNAIQKAEAEILAARQKNAEAQQQQIADTVSAMKTMTAALDKVFEAAAGDSEQYEKFKKAITIVDATLSMAQAIASAIAVSTKGDPYTLALRVAAAVAEVTAQFAVVISTINSVNVPSAGSYSAGGIVPGNANNDELVANVSSGEMILNKAQQQRLFELIAAGAPVRPIDYDRLAAAVAEGVKRMPAPVLDYREMVMFGDKVKMIERKNSK